VALRLAIPISAVTVIRVRRANGTIETLGGCDQRVMKRGDAVILTTPTGGGYGKPKRGG
jgi:N-methylhydantoinase B/oxoprolinase/acetone carboxylase alpha subunit